jgi:CoA:oxalate CoA-transferase
LSTDFDPSDLLKGLRVLDLTHHVAGPYCTKWLASLGADVLKVERPVVGDIARHIGPFPPGEKHPEKSALFLYLNTGKRSITLDLKSERGRDLLLRLAEKVDIIVENFAPRVLPSLGLDYETLGVINPRLVLTSISNFGQTGPYRDLRATDIVISAMGGLMYLVGLPDEAPLKFGGYQSLYIGGLAAFGSTMLAVTRAELTGEGQQVDVSLFEGMVCNHFQSLVQYEYCGDISRRAPAFGVVPCADGFVGMVVFDQHWQTFVDMIELPELRDERFSTLEGRIANHEEIEAAILSWTIPRTKQEIYTMGQEAGLPGAFFANIDDLLISPQYVARRFFTEVDHPVAGSYLYPGSPLRFDGEVPALRRAPLLGEHNEEVFRGELGLDRRELEDLTGQGII